MVKYTATFPTGQTVKINSVREPRTAWAIIDEDNKIIRHGFSGDYEKAQKTARGYLPSAMPHNHRSNDARACAWQEKYAKKKGYNNRKEWFAACELETIELRKGLKIIYADAKIVVAF